MENNRVCVYLQCGVAAEMQSIGFKPIEAMTEEENGTEDVACNLVWFGFGEKCADFLGIPWREGVKVI